jgi:WD40 repeat protein
MFWQNEKNNNYYIIECCFKKICIYNLLNNNELYAELISQNSAYSEHFSGIVYNNNDVDFLLVCTNNGYIEMWDLFKKILSLSININGSKLMDIIQWNNKYIIASDYENQCIKIIDITQMKIIGNYSGEGIISVKKIKKINNPKYGQGILSSGYDNKIKLWTL